MTEPHPLSDELNYLPEIMCLKSRTVSNNKKNPWSPAMENLSTCPGTREETVKMKQNSSWGLGQLDKALDKVVDCSTIK